MEPDVSTGNKVDLITRAVRVLVSFGWNKHIQMACVQQLFCSPASIPVLDTEVVRATSEVLRLAYKMPPLRDFLQLKRFGCNRTTWVDLLMCE